MEGKGESEQRHTHFVVRRKVYDLLWAGARTFHRYLCMLKLNLMRLRLADDGIAEFLICIEGSKPIRAPACAAMSRSSPRNSMLASSHEAICQPAMMANARTASPRINLTLPMTIPVISPTNSLPTPHFSGSLRNRRGSVGPLKHNVRGCGFFADIGHSQDARRVPGSRGARNVPYFLAAEREDRVWFRHYIAGKR